MPHISILDFIPWPAFRELAVQLPAMQERMMWLINMMTTIRCDWSHTTEESLCQNKETGLVDLCSLGKVIIFLYQDGKIALDRGQNIYFCSFSTKVTRNLCAHYRIGQSVLHSEAISVTRISM